MHRTLHYCAAALALLALAEGFSPAAVGGSALLGRRLRACPAGVGAHGLAPLRAARRPARRGRCGGLAMQTGESSATKNIIVGVLAFGFLFGALFPLINNGLRIGTAGDEMSGAATGMRQKELDERLAKVPTFAVTDDKGKPYVAEFEGKNKGFFFLDPADALSFAERVKQLQQAGAPVVVRPTTLDNAIKYVKTSQNNADPFEIVPISEQVQIAEAIKSPDTCDICWGTEGVKKKVPVFWVEGLGLQSEGENKVVTPVFFDKNDAVKFWTQINKDKEPRIEVFDLSALIKKMKKGGTTEFRKVAFYPSRKAIETAAAKQAADGPSVFPADKSAP